MKAWENKMKPIKVRYSKIREKFPREFILLQGTGCFWKKCAFCDYYEDISRDPFEVNAEIINKITGEFRVLDAVNSGSAMELDGKTLDLLIKKVNDCKIKEIWFEAHWKYRNKLKNFAENFKNSVVKFRTGIETFDPALRAFWNKGIPESVKPQDIAKYFQSVCLLVGTQRQSFESVVSDIKIADKYFERFVINVFAPNSTEIKSNPELINMFIKEVYPKIKDNPKIEVLINNTDLGVG